MTAPDKTTLAVLIRLTQWVLDDVAADLQAGRVTTAKGDELATLLEQLAALVRQRTGAVVINSET